MLDKRSDEKYEKISRPHPRCRLEEQCKSYSLLAFLNDIRNCCIQGFSSCRSSCTDPDTFDLDSSYRNNWGTQMSPVNSLYFLHLGARNRKTDESVQIKFSQKFSHFPSMEEGDKKKIKSVITKFSLFNRKKLIKGRE